MATRSKIAMKYDDGRIRVIYCHWDGYLAGVGRDLLDKYTTKEEVNHLMNRGDLSTLKTSYHEWRNQHRPARVYFSEKALVENESESYMYLFKNGAWYWKSGYYPKSKWKLLTKKNTA